MTPHIEAESQVGFTMQGRAGNNRFESIRQANRCQIDLNLIHVEFDLSVWFQLQKPRHNV